MEGCRICLSYPKTLYSVFEDAETLNGPKTYAEMIASLSSVKIADGDGSPDKVCRSCSKKVQEAYGLQILIERSNVTFQLNTKRFKFNNINEIKIEIDLPKVEEVENKADIKVIPNFDESDNILYNDTTIKKVNIDEKPVHILDLLESIKEDGFGYEESHFADNMSNYNTDYSDQEDIPLIKRKTKMKRKNKGYKKKRKQDSDDEYSPGPLDEGDEEYIPAWEKKKRVGPKRTYKKRTNAEKEDPTKPPKQKTERNFTKVLIKPVILRDVVAVPSTPKKRKKKENELKHKLQLCPHCGKQVKSLKYHLMVHTGERPFKCDQCSKSFFTEKLLSYHMAKHGSKDYKCSQCIAEFYTKMQLQSHMRMHSTEKKFVCNVCNKAFKRKTIMLRHQKCHNLANKNVQCELCNMSFFHKAGLAHHMRIHTGERPFNCELCSQPYSYKHDFNRHCLKKHGIFLKRRRVYVMNEEVLLKEREMIREVVRRAQGILKEGESINPFESEGPSSHLAFMQVVKAVENNQIQIPIDISYKTKYSDIT